MSVNSLIAQGGRGIKSPVERYLETKGQMERGGLRQAQTKGAYQTMGIRGQQQDQAMRQERTLMVAQLAKAVLSAPDTEKQLVYDQSKQKLTEMGIDMSQAPQVPDEANLRTVMAAGGLELDEQFKEIYKDGQPVSQQSTKSKRVFPHPEAPTKAEEGGPGAFSGKIKTISDTERRNMGKEFEIAGMLDRLEDDYKDEYSGFMSTNVADIAVAAGKRGFKYEEMADYMTKYQEWKNLVRNSLFGSQLTAPEMREFERQTINPAFTSKQNKKVLKRQKEILARGADRAKLSLKAKGWTDEMISEFEGSSKDDSDELTPEEMQELEMRESIIRQQPDGLGKVSRNPPVSR